MQLVITVSALTAVLLASASAVPLSPVQQQVEARKVSFKRSSLPAGVTFLRSSTAFAVHTRALFEDITGPQFTGLLGYFATNGEVDQADQTDQFVKTFSAEDMAAISKTVTKDPSVCNQLTGAIVKHLKPKSLGGISYACYEVALNGDFPTDLYKHLPLQFFKEGKETLLQEMHARVPGGAFRAMTAPQITEMLKNKDVCTGLDFSKLSDDGTRKTDAAMWGAMTATCMAEASKHDALVLSKSYFKSAPANILSKVVGKLHPSIFKASTAEQLAQLGAGIELHDGRCSNLVLGEINKPALKAITDVCLANYVNTRLSPDHDTAALPVEVIGNRFLELNPNLFAHLSVDGWRNLGHMALSNPEQLKFLTEAQAAAMIRANPESCAFVPTESRTVFPTKECFAHLQPATQVDWMRNRLSALPVNFLSAVPKTSVEKWQYDQYSGLAVLTKINKELTAEHLVHLGATTHRIMNPCALVDSKKDLLDMKDFVARMGPHCAAAIRIFGELSEADFALFDKRAFALFPVSFVRQHAPTLYATLDPTTFTMMANNPGFCLTIEQALMDEIKPEAIAGMTSSCLGQLKVNLSAAQFSKIPAAVFAKVDSASAESLKDFKALSPAQLAALSRDAADGKNAASRFTSETVKSWSAEHGAALTAAHVAAMPAKAFSGFAPATLKAVLPAALTTITFEQAKEIDVAALSAVSAEQVKSFGTKSSGASPARKAFTKAVIAKMSPDAAAAAEGLASGASLLQASASLSAVVVALLFAVASF